MRIVVLAPLILLSFSVAQAQVYKCTENGRTIYAERPCASNAKELNIDDFRTDEQRRQSLDSARRQKRLSKTNDIEAEIYRLEREKQSAKFQAAEEAKRRRCATLVKTAKDAKDESQKWRYHQGLIDDAKRRQKEAEDAHFSECYAKY